MARNSSAMMSSAWLCISVAFLLLPEIDGGDPTPCGKVILLDADQPTAQITDERYRLGGTEDDATNECLWYFRGPPGTTIRLDIVALEPMTEPFIVYDGLGIETDNDQGIQLGGRHGNSFVSSGRGLTCKLPTTLDDIYQETSVTMQATLQGTKLWVILLTMCL
ncbi:uncharacterized protein LOC115919786 [Strongylocentrotus purpuratus]|uniref:CUB domain-containing protein n=1 Tax=Strongylocentrotus purpuratus TaxID=7668 RepID=A0A7M7N1U5_STRPU|nr:uncharacterized protein LOC115919786 [Strongylocentrotus purpuratus]